MKIPDKINKFAIIDFLGNGVFGFVFHAFDPFLKVDRAIKLIKVPKPDKFVQAVKEAQTLESCRHKHIVDVKEVDVAIYEGAPYVYIAMEYLAKGSVQKYLEKRFISVAESLKVISEALLGLEHAHNNDILHRDIKPANMLIGDNDDIKLSDFGLAIDYHIDPSDTFGYRPHQPLEVIKGNPMNKLSDIYAMGITLYRLLNNIEKLNFKFGSVIEWEKAVKQKKFPDRNYLHHIPNKIVKIVNKSIHNSVEKRFQTTTEFRQAIEKLKIIIDWRLIDENHWIGNGCEIIKYSNRNGWLIDFKKNGRRIKDNCFKNLTENEVEEQFYRIIRDTTL
jgi:serine/threonine protein kinase